MGMVALMEPSLRQQGITGSSCRNYLQTLENEMWSLQNVVYINLLKKKVRPRLMPCITDSEVRGKIHPRILSHCWITSICDVECVPGVIKCCNLLFFLWNHVPACTSTSSRDFLHFPERLLTIPREEACHCSICLGGEKQCSMFFQVRKSLQTDEVTVSAIKSYIKIKKTSHSLLMPEWYQTLL